MYLSILGLGLLIGMQHAFEADHIAAVSAIASRQKDVRAFSKHGLAWGLGHTLMLLLVAGGALAFNIAISDGAAALMEVFVGVMLIGLGAHLLYRLWRERVHFHVHEHVGNARHFHAHSHKNETTPHNLNPHDHAHAHATSNAKAQAKPGTPDTLGTALTALPMRTFAIGLMHGMAGSAALVVIASGSIASPLIGLIYIALFGLGSIVGMAILSAVIAVPLSASAKYMTWANRSLQIAIGCLTIIVGSIVIQKAGASALSIYLSAA